MFNLKKQRNLDFGNVSEIPDENLIPPTVINIIIILVIALSLLFSALLTAVIINGGNFDNRLFEKCIRKSISLHLLRPESCFFFLKYIFSISYETWKHYLQNQPDLTSNSYLGIKLLIGSSPFICTIASPLFFFKSHTNKHLGSPRIIQHEVKDEVKKI